MSVGFDQALGVHADALTLRSRRSELLAANLANADTPGYLARDVDFRSVLDSIAEGGDLARTSSAHLDTGGTVSQPDVLYRVPTQVSLDGNTVEAHVEKAAFADNSLRYQASLRFLGGRLQTLLSAIRGE